MLPGRKLSLLESLTGSPPMPFSSWEEYALVTDHSMDNMLTFISALRMMLTERLLLKLRSNGKQTPSPPLSSLSRCKQSPLSERMLKHSNKELARLQPRNSVLNSPLNIRSQVGSNGHQWLIPQFGLSCSD